MGLLEALEGDRIYLDTNTWIYALEGYSAFRPQLMLLFEQMQAGTLTGITSELTLAELLVKPCRDQDLEQQAQYKKAIANRKNFFIMPVLRDLLIDAADVRAKTQLKLPDAIHAATALRTNCTTLLTNDRQIKKLPDIPVVLLSEVYCYLMSQANAQSLDNHAWKISYTSDSGNPVTEFLHPSARTRCALRPQVWFFQ